MKYSYHRDGTAPPRDDKYIFVFGSNLAGVHGAGAAREACVNYGAVMGVGVGHRGRSYALPTKDKQIKTLPIKDITLSVNLFLWHASISPEKTFWVTAVGCGLAGYKDKDIAPLFKEAPSNCSFPANWKGFLETEDE
jgi:hypothetical protein